MRIAITGATGFLGTPLQQQLRSAGHEVRTIGRARAGGRGPDVTWDPAAGTIDAPALTGVDAVIHLAGASIAQRWTAAARREIRDSRVQGTGLIARTLAAMSPAPRVLVSMSGMGIYGDRGDTPVDESTAPGSGFLADVATAWEAAADPARAAGIRVVHPRLGVVLHRAGGALARLVPIFALGGGGRIGSGRQWMPWISRPDALAALAFLATASDLAGPVNLVAPEASTNADFTRALATALHRPALFTVPAFAVKLAFGEMGVETVLGGQRARPQRLLEAGFAFRHPTLADALRDALA